MTGILLVFGSAIAWVALDAIRKVIGSRVAALSAAGAIAGAQLPFLLLGLTAVSVDFSPATNPSYWSYAIPTVALNVLAGFWFVRAVQESPLGLTIPYLSFTPVFNVVAGAVYLDQIPTVWGAVGIAVVVAGAVFLNPAHDGVFRPIAALKNERGSLFMLGVALLWSVTPTLDKKAVDLSSAYFHSISLSAGVALGALVLVTIQHKSLLRFFRDLKPIAANWLWIAAGANVLAIVLQLWSYSYVDVAYVETLKRAIGVIGAIAVGAMFFSERFKTATYLGALLMAVGVTIVVIFG